MPEGINFCPRCGGKLPPDGSFCPFCGLDIRFLGQSDGSHHKEKGGGLMRLVRFAGSWSSMLMALVLLVMGVTALWGSTIILPRIDDLGVTLFLIVPQILDLVTIMGLGAVLIYIIFLFAAIASLVWMLYEGRDRYAKELRGERLEKHSSLYTVSTLFFALISIQMIYYLILLAGQDVNTSNVTALPLWAQLYYLLEASVWEEVITRVLYLGFPMMIVMALRQDTRQKWYRYLWGDFELDRLAIVFILFSSVMFALGHLQSWDVFKLLPTFLVGLSLGYLFVRYGLYAAIMLHFAFDYLSLPAAVLGGTMPLVVTGLFVLFCSALGLPYILYYAKVGLETLLERPITLPKRDKREEEEDNYVYLPRPICPQCGHDTIRVHEHDYECTRCKKRF
ncbi:MAG: CPBP family glutamic-type intramembrane protease [Candidatus Methanomethylophilaceae archaeon]|nr:CPBP family glutamic-type intramembrane protease [Candidatus Methanomethylophilaceae archaeon]